MTTHHQTGACGDCLFYKAAIGAGECRRRAPICAILGAPKWPQPMPHDWCGEFRSKTGLHETISEPTERINT